MSKVIDFYPLQKTWVKICALSIDKKLLDTTKKATLAHQDQKKNKLHNQQRCLNKYIYCEKSDSKLLMNFDY